MRIAFVYDAIYPWVKGGAEKRIYELGRRLAGQGNEVHVFGIKWWEGPEIIEHEGMVLHGVCTPMELYVNGRRSISEAVIFSLKLLPHLSGERFDIIDASAFPYFPCFTVKLVSILKRTRAVVTWHEVWGDYWYEYIGWRGFFGKLIEHFVSKLSSDLIAVSAATKDNLGLMGVESERIHIIPNGIDTERIKWVAPSSDGCDILFAGRLIKEKNVDVLLEAVNHLRQTVPDVKCRIIGDGPEKERLIGLAGEQGLLDNVKFSGFMEYDEIIACMKSSKVLALPSSREGFGMVVIEAFACGVPVITVKNKRNAASMLVSKGTGFIVNPDARELSGAFRTIITDSVLRKKMSAVALDASRVYDWDKMVSELIYLYKELI